jgi:ATP-dependent helicase/nuclease subunit B
VAHHPLAELTRGALRTAAWGWQHADWFSALKSGLAHRDHAALDWLENEALARGWQGPQWLEPLVIPDQPRLAARLEALRAQLVPPFARLARTLTESPPSGLELADALFRFWTELGVEAELARWADAAVAGRAESAAAMHRTVWEQMLTWLDNVRLAFSTERLPAREWLPILEAGLASLSVGVIPPALDQVLVGAVDRSRNPDLRQVILLGLNDGVFPATPAAPILLTETERARLGGLGLDLAADRRRLLGRERYFGYIACTRARERLVATFSRADAADRPLGPSAWVTWLQRLFPALEIETAREPAGPAEAIHASELLLAGLPPERLAAPAARSLVQAAGWTPEQLVQWRAPAEPAADRLSPVLAARLYGSPRRSRDDSVEEGEHTRPRVSRAAPSPVGSPCSNRTGRCHDPAAPEVAGETPATAPETGALPGPTASLRLRTSVSTLEQFAACPFQFFIAAGLRADERRRFEVDARQRGSFHHEVLRRFHEAAVAAGRRWRDFTPDEARDGVGRIARAVAEEFGGGLLQADEAGTLTARGLTRMLQDFVAALVAWMRRSYAFDPVAAELAFGGRNAALPAWALPLAGGGQLEINGQVDRVDVAPAPEPGARWCVVHDYKSSERRFDALLFRHGIQMQLPAYLAAVCALDWPGRLPALPPGTPGPDARLRPAGLFYANLRGSFSAGKSRGEVLAQDAGQAASAYQHRGRFTTGALDALDARPDGAPSGQFAYRLTKEGQLTRRAGDALSPAEFAEIETQLREKLVELAGRILAGEVAVDPYQKGARQRACDQCRFQAICRIDPWTHRYRRLI